MARYTLANPTGNITALVESPVAPALRRETAAAIMAAEPRAEQLGFLSTPEGEVDIALYMAGGEFCGNACLSAAAWLLRSRGLEQARFLVSVSGAEKPVAVDIRRTGENEFYGFVDMPLPLSIGSIDTYPLVSFPGISHIIAPPSLKPEEAEAIILPLCLRLEAEALGIMLFDESRSALRPLVYVPGIGSLFWESSCASGSAAVGAAMAVRYGRSLSLSLDEPGGLLSIEAVWDGKALSGLRMGGKVSLIPEKIVEKI